jgi:Fe-S cluster assembly iron-binding protein IscA
MPHPFCITDAALHDMRVSRDEFAYPEDMVRIGVVFVPSRQYWFDFVAPESVTLFDRILEYPHVRVVLDQTSFRLLEGYVLDYGQCKEGLGLRFYKLDG